jgi:hypothetical protein
MSCFKQFENFSKHHYRAIKRKRLVLVTSVFFPNPIINENVQLVASVIIIIATLHFELFLFIFLKMSFNDI